MGKKNEIIISCPNDNNSERTYIIKLLLEEFLDFNCIILFKDDVSNYVLKFNSNIIVIEDHFFKHFAKSLSYIDIKNIPNQYASLSKTDLPIIYGRDFLKMDGNEVRCGLDIFASSFFLLTRWEEFVLPKRKDGLRCDEEDLFMVKNELIHRPLVNEYLELLKGFFAHFNFNIKTERRYTILQTHDVDWIYLSSLQRLLQNLKVMVVRNKLYKKSWDVLWRYIYYRMTFTNPFDSFKDFMDFSETLSLKNSFYFKTCLYDERGATYDYNNPQVKKTVSNILERGHYVGFHPSENTFKNDRQFGLEYNRLKEISSSVIGGRQHHLLYDSSSFETWDKFDLIYDSGYGYQFRNGFRCGICYDYSIFDVFKREQLRLKQIPFLIMDTAYLRKNSTPKEMEKESKKIVDIVKKYEGTLCTVWHSNMFKTLERKKFINSYYNIIKYAAKRN